MNPYDSNGHPRLLRLYDGFGLREPRYTAVLTHNYPGRQVGVSKYVTFGDKQEVAVNTTDGYIDGAKYSHLGKRIHPSELPPKEYKMLLTEYQNHWGPPA